MRPRTIELRGWPATLMLGLLVAVVVGIIVLLVMVGAAVAVAGLAVSAVAALYYTVRRKLAGIKKPMEWQTAEPPPASTAIEVREIEVEVLPQNRDQA